MCSDPGPRKRFLNLAEGEEPRSVTLSVTGATTPPAAPLRGLRKILPVLEPPRVRLCIRAVWRVPPPPFPSVSAPETDALPLDSRLPVIYKSLTPVENLLFVVPVPIL